MTDESRTGVDPAKVAALHAEETTRFTNDHPRCQAAHRASAEHLPAGVPMSWMAKWAGPFPLTVTEAQGSTFSCLDGHEFTDLCLGDTGAMTGHSPAATVEAVRERLGRGITMMLPTEDAAPAAAELANRFGLPKWQFTLSATDANRHVIRYARHLTGRPKIAVMDYCYHGSVDETFATLDDSGRVVARRGNIGPPVDPSETTVVVPFNDLTALEAALAKGDVAAVLTEPALTNIGIVLPEAGYLDGLRELTRQYGTLLVLDETHTLCAGPGGMTARDGLQPDIITLGKAIGGGVPCGAFGLSDELAERILTSVELEDVDLGGIGGTLAGNALSLAAIRATLGQVLTAEAMATMEQLATEWTDGVQAGIDAHSLPWHVVQLGGRAEYAFSAQPARTGAEAAAADDFDLQTYLHLAALNDRLLLTPFHNMALMAPSTTSAQVAQHTASFDRVTAALSRT